MVYSLRSEILECLAYNGKLSKSMVERMFEEHIHITKADRPVKHHHKEILSAFGFLKTEGLIDELNTNPGPGLVFERGRPKTYYEITEKGFKLLITQNIRPIKFWKCILGYCDHNTSNISLAKVEEFCHLFIEKYLKYRNHSYSFQLDIFDNMRDKWFHEMIGNDKTSLEQKIIEVLAIYPRITFEELVKKTRGKKSDINKLLSTFTLESYRPLMDKTYYIHQNTVGKRFNKKYWDLLLHSTILVSQNSKGIKTYELSLFGVILALTLVRYYDMDELKHGLYYTRISFAEYYDRISSNYRSKLPLIFGKWKLLKGILKIASAYNFDVILDKDIRIKDSDKLSVTRGGNKELYEGIREIVFQNRQQLGDVANAGWAVWLNYIGGMQYEYRSENQDDDYLMKNNVNIQSRPDPQKVYVVSKKINEITISLNPLEHISKSGSVQPEVIREISRKLEELFADEITAFYYFHLYYDYEFSSRFIRSAKYYSSVNHDDKSSVSQTPKDCLWSIIRNDTEKPLIGEWFYGWMQDISNLQKDIYETSKSATQYVEKVVG
jgi:hypothetical protein